MGNSKISPNYLFFCPKHGYDINNGDKNPCCDSCQAIPMLEPKDLDILNEEGQKVFAGDFGALHKFAETNVLPADVDEWFNLMESEFTQDALEEAAEEAAEETQGQIVGTVGHLGDDEGGEEQQDELFHPEQTYMHGFTTGFANGFDKGFDSARRIYEHLKANK